MPSYSMTQSCMSIIRLMLTTLTFEQRQSLSSMPNPPALGRRAVMHAPIWPRHLSLPAPGVRQSTGKKIDDCTILCNTLQFPRFRCSDGADRLREHWDENECAYTNITTAEQCSDELSHTEWRNSMVQHDRSGSNDSSAGSGTVVSAVISSILVLILIGVGAVFIYLYGRNNPGGIAERIGE